MDNMKTGKNVFRFLSPVLALCGLLVFGIIFSGCNDSDGDNDGTTETMAWYMDADGYGYGDPDTSIQADT